MKEHEHPRWSEKKRDIEDRDTYTSGNTDYKVGKRHKKYGSAYNPPRKDHEGSYEQGYNSKD